VSKAWDFKGNDAVVLGQQDMGRREPQATRTVQTDERITLARFTVANAKSVGLHILFSKQIIGDGNSHRRCHLGFAGLHHSASPFTGPWKSAKPPCDCRPCGHCLP
jgi:hypothetical protein